MSILPLLSISTVVLLKKSCLPGISVKPSPDLSSGETPLGSQSLLYELAVVTRKVAAIVTWPSIAGFVARVFRPRKSSGRQACEGEGKCRQRRAIRFLAITKDIEFLDKLKAVADGQSWTLAAASALDEALNVTAFEDFPVVVLDHLACEGTWETSVAALVSSAQGVWWPPPEAGKRPKAARSGAGRRFFMSAKAPCVILASQYSDEYLRREVVRLGGHDVLNKSAPQHVVSRAIEFACFWSEHSITTVKPVLPGPPPFLTSAVQGPRH
jgi:hypothetical protein